MNFSSRTTSLDVQRNFEANVEKRTKDTYGPPPGKRLIVFIDDMNMPQVYIWSIIISSLLWYLGMHSLVMYYFNQKPWLSDSVW